MKQEDIKIRNPAAIPAHSRKSAGPMKDRSQKRLNGENKNQKYLDDVFDDLHDEDNIYDCWD